MVVTETGELKIVGDPAKALQAQVKNVRQNAGDKVASVSGGEQMCRS